MVIAKKRAQRCWLAAKAGQRLPPKWSSVPAIFPLLGSLECKVDLMIHNSGVNSDRNSERPAAAWLYSNQAKVLQCERAERTRMKLTRVVYRHFPSYDMTLPGT